MSELPTREPRPPAEQFADAQAIQEYFRSPEDLGSIRYISEGGEWVPVIPGHRDYERALPNRYSREDGMSIPPWHLDYEDAAKKRPRRFR